MVWDINREKVMMAPERIQIVTKYILEHFDQKTYRGDKTYMYNTLTNIAKVVSAKRDEVEEIKQKQRISGFNSIFAVSSVPMAKLYYQEFKKQMAEVYTTSVSKATLDECPMAYKGMQDILDNIGPTAEVRKIIRPIYNFKAGDEE